MNALLKMLWVFRRATWRYLNTERHIAGVFVNWLDDRLLDAIEQVELEISRRNK